MSTSALRSARAARRPPKPPPTMTTCGRPVREATGAAGRPSVAVVATLALGTAVLRVPCSMGSVVWSRSVMIAPSRRKNRDLPLSVGAAARAVRHQRERRAGEPHAHAVPLADGAVGGRHLEGGAVHVDVTDGAAAGEVARGDHATPGTGLPRRG